MSALGGGREVVCVCVYVCCIFIFTVKMAFAVETFSCVLPFVLSHQVLEDFVVLHSEN